MFAEAVAVKEVAPHPGEERSFRPRARERISRLARERRKEKKSLTIVHTAHSVSLSKKKKKLAKNIEER